MTTLTCGRCGASFTHAHGCPVGEARGAYSVEDSQKMADGLLYWEGRARRAEADLKRCQDALIRLELDRLENAQIDGHLEGE